MLHLVGYILEYSYDARTHERQIKSKILVEKLIFAQFMKFFSFCVPTLFVIIICGERKNRRMELEY